MASEEPVRMLEGDTKDFELTELDGRKKNFWVAICQSVMWPNQSA